MNKNVELTRIKTRLLDAIENPLGVAGTTAAEEYTAHARGQVIKEAVK